LGKISEEVIKSRGTEALYRIRKKSGSSKALKSEFVWKEMERLLGEGWNQFEVAKGLRMTPRNVRRIKALYAGETIHIGRVAKLEQKHPEMHPFTAEAFISFFEFYNPDGYLVPDHVKPWIEAFIRERNLLLNVPPRHSKSHYFSLWIPLWLICRDRNVQIILISLTKDFARGWASEIAGQLESNEKLLEDLGRFAPDKKGDFAWRPEAGTFAVRGRTRRTRGAQLTIQSRGMEQQILGMEADYTIIDDPTSQEVASSETDRVKALAHLQEQVLTRLQKQTAEGSGGRAIVVGQRVHPKDMYGELAAQEFERGPLKGTKFWHNEKYPAISKWPEHNNGVAEVLWPEMWPFDELMIQFERVGGTRPFNALYQQEPSAEGSALIKPEWFDGCKDPTRRGYEGVKDQLSGVSRVLSVDPSPNKWHGIVLGDLVYDRDQFYFVVIEVKHIFAGNEGLRALIADIKRIAESYDIDYLVYEQSTFSKWIFEHPDYVTLKEDFKLIKHKTAANKNDAEYGVQSLAGDFEFNHISLPYGDTEGMEMTDLLGKEALNYIPGEKNLDDILMALWFIKFNWRRLRPPVSYMNAVKGSGWSWMEDLKKRKVAYVG
jgi:hypothetical protein